MGYLSQRGAHFGKAKFYTVVTLEGQQIVDVETVSNPGHDAGACGNAVQNIISLHPDALVVSGIGSSPAKGFTDAGLTLYVDRESVNVLASIRLLLGNRLESSMGKGTCNAH